MAILIGDLDVVGLVLDVVDLGVVDLGVVDLGVVDLGLGVVILGLGLTDDVDDT